MKHLITVSLKEILLKKYHRKGNQLNQSDQNFEFIFGGNNEYHQIRKAFLEINITVRKNDDTTFRHEDPVRLVNNGYAFCFKEARLSTTIGSHIEIKNFCGQVSTIMRAITNKAGDLLTQLYNMKMISQILRDWLIYHPKLDLHLIKKC